MGFWTGRFGCRFVVDMDWRFLGRDLQFQCTASSLIDHHDFGFGGRGGFKVTLRIDRELRNSRCRCRCQKHQRRITGGRYLATSILQWTRGKYSEKTSRTASLSCTSGRHASAAFLTDLKLPVGLFVTSYTDTVIQTSTAQRVKKGDLTPVCTPVCGLRTDE